MIRKSTIVCIVRVNKWKMLPRDAFWEPFSPRSWFEDTTAEESGWQCKTHILETAGRWTLYLYRLYGIPLCFVLAKKLLIVLDAPKITCHFASAYLDDHDTNIRCKITSNPSVLNFYWIVDSNGTTLNEDDTLAEYRTTAKVGHTQLMRYRVFEFLRFGNDIISFLLK